MKTILLSLLVLAGVATSAASAESANPTPTAAAFAIPVRRADVDGWTISRGTPRQIVLNHWGTPDVTLSGDVWVFSRFHARQKRAEARDCRLLVVTFVGDKVADLQLVNARAQAILADRVSRGLEPIARRRTKSEVAAEIGRVSTEVVATRPHLAK